MGREAHPEEYPMGEYDPELSKLRSRFKRIIEDAGVSVLPTNTLII